MAVACCLFGVGIARCDRRNFYQLCGDLHGSLVSLVRGVIVSSLAFLQWSNHYSGELSIFFAPPEERIFVFGEDGIRVAF